ncbi:MAG: class I SAM-dependent methyltransferase [Bdellovibrionaceae bacterium]|nr:class I SAM-dependent methyltransferase [Pseudobdellovibrionaceae bacterium]
MEIGCCKKKKIQKIFNHSYKQKLVVSTEEVPVFQQNLKKLGSFYYFLVRVLGPVLNHPMNKKQLDSICARFGEESIILNIGSGPVRVLKREDIINLDVTPYNEVDILIESEELPIKSNVVDLIINIAVLEHVPNPDEMVSEIYRCLKPGGYAFIFVPFMQPFHAAPHDFMRWTKAGVMKLFSGFKIDSVWIGGGPTSGWLWVFQEWLALIFSFGLKALYQPLLYFFMIVTSPLKLLDLVLIYHPHADKIASGFYILVQKE